MQENDVGLESGDDMLILSPVSRKDSGIYQCRPVDTDGNTDVKGEMQLIVHCKGSSHNHTQKYIQQKEYSITGTWIGGGGVRLFSPASTVHWSS